MAIGRILSGIPTPARGVWRGDLPHRWQLLPANPTAAALQVALRVPQLPQRLPALQIALHASPLPHRWQLLPANPTAAALLVALCASQYPLRLPAAVKVVALRGYKLPQHLQVLLLLPVALAAAALQAEEAVVDAEEMRRTYPPPTTYCQSNRRTTHRS